MSTQHIRSRFTKTLALHAQAAPALLAVTLKVRRSCCNLPTSPHALATLATFPIRQKLLPARTKQDAWLNAPASFSSLSVFLVAEHSVCIWMLSVLRKFCWMRAKFTLSLKKRFSRRSCLNFLSVGMRSTLQHLAGNSLCTEHRTQNTLR